VLGNLQIFRPVKELLLGKQGATQPKVSGISLGFPPVATFEI
jgi:hypothetical protein